MTPDHIDVAGENAFKGETNRCQRRPATRYTIRAIWRAVRELSVSCVEIPYINEIASSFTTFIPRNDNKDTKHRSFPHTPSHCILLLFTVT